MSPRGGSVSLMEKSIAKVIDYYFNTFDNLKDQLSKAAISRFGSGYGWLVLDDEELSVMSTPNQDTPLQRRSILLLVIDVWNTPIIKVSKSASRICYQLVAYGELNR